MEKEKMNAFLDSCNELINSKFLVAEYKIQRMLKALSNSEEICALIGECLEQYNREREFSKTFIQDGHGNFVCEMPTEEYKIIALVFCTLVDIDNKKIDIVDFVKRFFGKNENPFKGFIETMVVPFRDLITDAFGFSLIPNVKEDEQAEEDFESEQENKIDENVYIRIQKIAVQILSELQFVKQDKNCLEAIAICKAIVKAALLEDEEIMYALLISLKSHKIKQVKFLLKEMYELFDL